jgi:purine-binding chemotaxis protein CheW
MSPAQARAAKLRQLRSEFDQGFALQAEPAVGEQENYLAVRVAGHPYALSLSEIAGLFADRSLTYLPSSVPELLGIASFRGQTAPVYDLAALLGYASSPPYRWLLLLKAESPLALAFEFFEAHVSSSQEQAPLPQQGEHAETREADIREADIPARLNTRASIRALGAIRPVLQLQNIVDIIRERALAATARKE